MGGQGCARVGGAGLGEGGAGMAAGKPPRHPHRAGPRACRFHAAPGTGVNDRTRLSKLSSEYPFPPPSAIQPRHPCQQDRHECNECAHLHGQDALPRPLIVWLCHFQLDARQCRGPAYPDQGGGVGGAHHSPGDAQGPLLEQQAPVGSQVLGYKFSIVLSGIQAGKCLALHPLRHALAQSRGVSSGAAGRHRGPASCGSHLVRGPVLMMPKARHKNGVEQAST